MIVAYICHPISGDVKGNIEKVLSIVRSINLNEPFIMPFAPYIADCLALDDDIPSQRERGLENAVELLGRGIVDELRVYGEPSEGMKREISLAELHRIPIKYFSAPP